MFARSLMEFLEANGYGKIDKTLFINDFPSRTTINKAICAFDRQPLSVRGRARNSVDFSCQLQVRDNLSSKASETALEIYNLLERGYIHDGSGKRFVIRPLNPPNFLMFDSSNRAVWTLDVRGLSHNY